MHTIYDEKTFEELAQKEYDGIMSGYTERLPDILGDYFGHIMPMKAYLTLNRSFGEAQLDRNIAHYILITVDYYLDWDAIDRVPSDEELLEWMQVCEDSASLNGQPSDSHGQRLERHNYDPIPVPKRNKKGYSMKDYGIDANDPELQVLMDDGSDIWLAMAEDAASIFESLFEGLDKYAKKKDDIEELKKAIKKVLDGNGNDKKANRIREMLRKLKRLRQIPEEVRTTITQLEKMAKEARPKAETLSKLSRYAKFAKYFNYLGIAGKALEAVLFFMDYLEYEETGDFSKFHDSTVIFVSGMAIYGVAFAFGPVVGCIIAVLDIALTAATGKSLSDYCLDFVKRAEDVATEATKQAFWNMFEIDGWSMAELTPIH